MTLLSLPQPYDFALPQVRTSGERFGAHANLAPHLQLAGARITG